MMSENKYQKYLDAIHAVLKSYDEDCEKSVHSDEWVEEIIADADDMSGILQNVAELLEQLGK